MSFKTLVNSPPHNFLIKCKQSLLLETLSYYKGVSFPYKSTKVMRWKLKNEKQFGLILLNISEPTKFHPTPPSSLVPKIIFGQVTLNILNPKPTSL